MKYLMCLLFFTGSHFCCQQIGKKTPVTTQSIDTFYQALRPIPPSPLPLAEEMEEDTVDLLDVCKREEVDVEPFFKEGHAAFLRFIRQNLESPHFPRMVYGTVYVGCVVETDGTLTHVKVKRGIGGGWDEYAERVLKKTSGKWQCGFCKDQPARTAIVLAVKCDPD